LYDDLPGCCSLPGGEVLSATDIAAKVKIVAALSALFGDVSDVLTRLGDQVERFANKGAVLLAAEPGPLCRD
jgi:hypothetical protein